MKLSIIAILHDSPDYLEEFYTRVSTAAWILVGEDYELILCHDRQEEPHPAVFNTLVPADSHLLLQHGCDSASILNALATARGENIFLVTITRREDPEWMLAFSAAMADNGSDLVYAVREKLPHGYLQGFVRSLRRLFRQEERENLSATMLNSRVKDALLASGRPEILFQRPIPLEDFRQQSFSVIVNDPEAPR